jgi:hypothetical protein
MNECRLLCGFCAAKARVHVSENLAKEMLLQGQTQLEGAVAGTKKKKAPNVG